MRAHTCTHTHTCAYIHTHIHYNVFLYLCQVFGFYEELLSSRFPFSNCKLVFVDESYLETSSYSTLCLCSTNLLHSHRVIDGVQRTRTLLAEALARQYFGCFISNSCVYVLYAAEAPSCVELIATPFLMSNTQLLGASTRKSLSTAYSSSQ